MNSLRTPEMRTLLAKHGAPGPYAYVVLVGEAKARAHGFGVANMTWSELQHFAGIDGDSGTVRTLLDEMVDLDLIEWLSHNEQGFAVRLRHFEEWDPIADEAA